MMGGGFWGRNPGSAGSHMFDKARSRKWRGLPTSGNGRRCFCHHLEVMYHLTKSSKGRVTEADIHIASQLMIV